MTSNYIDLTESPEQLAEKKKLAKNPFKPAADRIPLKSSQPNLNFFKVKNPNSSQRKPDPLRSVSPASLNRRSPTPDFFKLTKSKSSLSQLTKETFNDDFDDDLSFVKEVPLNLKSSSSVERLSQQNNEASVIPLSVKDVHSKTIPSSTQKIKSLSSYTLSRSKSDNINTSFKRKLDPYDQSINNKLRLKNPRVKEETRAQKSGSIQLGLSDEQNHVINLVVDKGMSVFYTGSAGTGKSVLLRELVSRLTKKYRLSAVAVTASTGLAAVNIGGITINKFSGMGIASGKASDIARKVAANQFSRQRWKDTKVLIIDEISMIDDSFLDKLEYTAKYVRKDQRPFGGIQIVLTGDFFQLPPVPNRNEPAPLFCFQAKCWTSCIQKTILLKKVFRQKNNEFVDLLNCLRLGKVTDEMNKSFQALSRDVYYEDGIQPTELFCTRYEVEQANAKRLNGLSGQMRVFEAEDEGHEYALKLLDNLMAVKTLVLKEDAQVMMIKNKDETLVNGSVGKVITFLTTSLYAKIRNHYTADSICNEEATVKQLRLISRCVSETQLPDEVRRYAQTLSNYDSFMSLVNSALKERVSELEPLIKFTTGQGPRIELIEKVEFSTESKKTESLPKLRSLTDGTRRQLPLLLSWALSIHKSQGQTLDRVKVDLTRVFEIGQVYVALSRAVSKDRLQIVNFQRQKIRSSDVVKRFYAQLESL